jgi:hypothetical protein
MARVILSGGGEAGSASILFLGPDVRPALSVTLMRDGTGAIRLVNSRGGVTIGAEVGGQSIIGIEDRDGRERIRLRVGPDGKADIQRLSPEGGPEDGVPQEGDGGHAG